MALAGVLAVAVQRAVQVAVHVAMGAARDIAVDELPDRIGIALQVGFERGGRLFDAGENFGDVLHSAFLPLVGRFSIES